MSSISRLVGVVALACVLPAPVLAQVVGSWDLATLRKPPAIDVLVADGQGATVSSSLYEGAPYQGKPTRVFAYLAEPARKGDEKLPAMVLVHGGGGKAFLEWVQLWAKRGYVALAMDLAGNGPDGKRLPDGGPNQSDDEKFG